MRLTGISTPIAQAISAFVAAVVNLGLLFGWYHWTQAQTAGVNVVVLAALSLISAFRAGAQRSGTLVDVAGHS